MKQLRTFRHFLLLIAMTASASHAADQVLVAQAVSQTRIVVLPQVVIVGKRLNAMEKNRLAQTSQPTRTVRPAPSPDDKS
jgi:hypothetical protein